MSDAGASFKTVGTRFRWPVSVERTIEASANAVWDVISRPGNMESWHPFCASNPVRAWPGPGSIDEVHYLSGWKLERRFDDWIEGVGYDLTIGRPGGRQSSVSWRISPVDDRSCRLSITLLLHALQNMPVAIRWIPHYLWLRPMMRKYLDSVVRGIEWYVTRGEPVARDQFGEHPWFSTSESAPG